jgi:hypothetical protein
MTFLILFFSAIKASFVAPPQAMFILFSRKWDFIFGVQAIEFSRRQ